MIRVTCPECKGRGYDVAVTCQDCMGSRLEPKEDNPLAQCNTCHGDGEVEVDICPKCDGSGQIDIEYDNIDTPELSEDGLYNCSECLVEPASFILVDYHHTPLGYGIFYCSQHAFDNGREQCPCCYDYQIMFEGQSYLPTYPKNTLDGRGCCADHP